MSSISVLWITVEVLLDFRTSRFSLFSLLAFLIFAPTTLPAATETPRRPRLILVLVIDQFRADYLTRFEDKFIAPRSGSRLGGFRYLMSEGAYFPFGEYDILQCMTGPGHATILTGSFPYLAGIPANDWFGREKGDRMYCVEDPLFPTVGGSPPPHPGTSPRNLLSTTVGDELKNAGLSGRVVSISLKDRAAILLGGHRADLALWYTPNPGNWVSSKFYLPDGALPPWVVALNQELKSDVKCDVVSLCGLKITKDAAVKAIETLQLGSGKATDLLAVSFSSHDYLGHRVGPNSPEMEKMTLEEDRLLSDLLNTIEEKIPGGMKNVVTVLTADHGIPPDPDWLKKERMDAGRINIDDWVKRIEAVLVRKHGGPPKGTAWVPYAVDLNFFLNEELIRKRHLNLSRIEEEVKEVLRGAGEFAHTFSSSDYAARKLPPGMIERQILHTYFPGRSGNVVAIPRPFFMEGKAGVNHLTGYSYDRQVPIVFAGFGIKPGIHSEHAGVVDIAPTLSFLAGVLAPSLSEGRVLSEILKD